MRNSADYIMLFALFSWLPTLHGAHVYTAALSAVLFPHEAHTALRLQEANPGRAMVDIGVVTTFDPFRS